MPVSRPENRLFAHVLLIAASCALSALAILRDPLVNETGVRYLVLAQRVAAEGLAAFQAPTGFSLYALAIAAVQAGSGLSVLASARLLDAALFALLALGFARLVELLGADRRFYGWGAVVLLLFPQLNAFRGLVGVESAFWALLLGSLPALGRYLGTQRWQDALAWAAWIVAAAAFRAEALVYALLLPLACLWPRRDMPRLAGLVRLHACLAAIALLPLLALARFGLLAELSDQVFTATTAMLKGTANGFAAASARYASLVLDPQARAFASWSLAAGLLALLALGFAASFGLPYLCLLGWGILTRRGALPDPARGLHRCFLGCALLVVTGAVARSQHVAPAEMLPLCLAALIPCVFAARELVTRAMRSRLRTFARAALALLLLVLFAEGFLNLGSRTSYLLESIAWVQDNVPAHAVVLSNDRRLAWYSGARVDWPAVERAGTADSAPVKIPPDVDYLIIHHRGARYPAGRDRLPAALLVPSQAADFEVAARFDGSPGQDVVVLRRRARPGG